MQCAYFRWQQHTRTRTHTHTHARTRAHTHTCVRAHTHTHHRVWPLIGPFAGRHAMQGYKLRGHKTTCFKKSRVVEVQAKNKNTIPFCQWMYLKTRLSQRVLHQTYPVQPKAASYLPKSPNLYKKEQPSSLKGSFLWIMWHRTLHRKICAVATKRMCAAQKAP